jgi:hypothetical protein
MNRIEAKELVKQVLKDMRSIGYITRMNFMCCGGCAGAAIAGMAEERIDRGDDIKGAIFWSRQSNDAFEEQAWKWSYTYKGHDLYINFGQVGTEKHGDVGHPTEVTGALLYGMLKAKGLNVEWDFDPNHCVIVNFEPE